MTPRVVFILFAAFLINSCGENNKESGEDISQGDSPEQLNESGKIDTTEALMKLDEYLYASFSQSPEDIISNYGKPDRIIIDTIRNMHSDELDELLTINYENMSVWTYHYVSGHKYLLRYLELQRDFARDEINIKLNSTPEEIVDLIGNPVTREMNQDTLTYEYHAGDAREQIFFKFKENRLVKLEYYPYFD